MKTLIAVMLLCLAVPAQAWDFELGIGGTHYKKDHNGRWWVEGYPYIEEIKDEAISVGISHKVGNYRYRAEFLNLGEFRMLALAPTDDVYSPISNSTKDVPIYRFVGRGNVAGVALTVSKEMKLFGSDLYVEAGPYIFKPTWQVDLYNEETDEWIRNFTTDGKLNVGPLIGVGVRYGVLDVGLRWMNVAGKDAMNPTPWRHAYTLMVKAVF